MRQRHFTLAAALAVLAACETAPVAPGANTARTAESAAPAGLGADDPCPAFESGPAPWTPPFPEACAGLTAQEDGLKWIEIAAGPDDLESPEPTATVVTQYEGFLAGTGERVDSSYERGKPAVFRLDTVIEGWSRLVGQMTAGDEWLAYVPAALAYGEDARGDAIPANSDLVYRIRLQGFLNEAETEEVIASRPTPIIATAGPDMAAWEAYYPWAEDGEDVIQLDSGVSYVVLEEGPARDVAVEAGDMLLVDYEGRLAETSDFFDSTWSRGAPALFEAGSLIPGFSEALGEMREGDRWLVHIPSDLAYGEAGAGESIPPNADLLFQIHLLAINPEAVAVDPDVEPEMDVDADEGTVEDDVSEGDVIEDDNASEK